MGAMTRLVGKAFLSVENLWGQMFGARPLLESGVPCLQNRAGDCQTGLPRSMKTCPLERLAGLVWLVGVHWLVKLLDWLRLTSRHGRRCRPGFQSTARLQLSRP